MKKQNAIQDLGFLIGNWKTQGQVFAGSPEDILQIRGTDSYEWLLNNQFILHKVNVTIGNEKTEAFEIIGSADASKNLFNLRSFDNKGGFLEMKGALDEKGKFHITGNKMRSILSVIDNTKMMAEWEKSDDNQNWIPWMEITLLKKS